MPVQVGKGHIYGLATLEFGISHSSVSGYISPKVETLSLTHTAEFTEEKDQEGAIDGLIGNPIGIQCSFRFKPKSRTAVHTIAQAVTAAYLPQVCAGVTITGLSIIKFAGFADVFNTNGGNTQPWIYDGNGSLEGVHDGVWTGVMTLRRYLGITSATAIT